MIPVHPTRRKANIDVQGISFILIERGGSSSPHYSVSSFVLPLSHRRILNSCCEAFLHVSALAMAMSIVAELIITNSPSTVKSIFKIAPGT